MFHPDFYTKLMQQIQKYVHTYNTTELELRIPSSSSKNEKQ